MSRSEKVSSYPAHVEQEKKEKESPVVIVGNKAASIEIGGRCFTGCEYCFLKGLSNKDGLMQTLDQVIPTLDWVERFTDATVINLLGGEVLLNPDFPKIVAEIRKRGFELNVITSGVYNRRNAVHVENANFMVSEFTKGSLGVIPTYHPGRNEKSIESLLPRLLQAMPGRKENLSSTDKKGKSGGFRINLPIPRPDSVSPDKFISRFEFLVNILGRNMDEGATDRNSGQSFSLREMLLAKYPNIQKNYAEFGESEEFGYSIDINVDGNNVGILSFGVDEIKESPNNINELIIKRPQGTAGKERVCGMFLSKSLNDSQYLIPSILVRSDGEATFNEPGCYGLNSGLLNINDPRSWDKNYIVSRISAKVEQVKGIIKKVNHAKTSKRTSGNGCDESGCNSCPFDIACTICHGIKEPEVRLIDPATL